MGLAPSVTPGLHPVISLFGGVAGINASTNKTQSFIETDDNVFAYYSGNNSQVKGFGGAFLGAEYQLPNQGLFLQGGIEYDYFGNSKVNGLNTVGIEPVTSTSYNYLWKVQAQQILAVAKLFATKQLTIGTPHLFFPYLSVGLGGAFNKGSGFIWTQETGSVNVTPTFNNHSQTSFSYSLGLGVDTPINSNMRFGLGYRFSDFGAASLGNGFVKVNQYSAPVSFTLSTTHTYANQFIVQLSYLA